MAAPLATTSQPASGKQILSEEGGAEEPGERTEALGAGPSLGGSPACVLCWGEGGPLSSSTPICPELALPDLEPLWPPWETVSSPLVFSPALSAF